MEHLNIQIKGTIRALLLFADIVDSSKYSSVLGYRQYAERLLEFQNLFKSFGMKYFPEPADRVLEFCEVKARGDEGTVFLATSKTDFDFGEAVFRSIEFLYHLKGLLRNRGSDDEQESQAPTKIGLGAGIHVGKVAFATKHENNRSIIDRVEGFSINYAKRVESCSRIGTYSRIFLSKEAGKLLEDKPVILSSTLAPLKGIHDQAEVYEAKSGFFEGLRINPTDEMDDERLVEAVRGLSEQPGEIEEPWEKALCISVLDWLIRNTPVHSLKAKYREAQSKLAWHTSVEDDPILLYLRAKDLEEKKQYSQGLRYLKNIVEEHPDFVHARKRLVRLCWSIAKKKSERSELALARDLAKEFIEKFPQFLTDAEKKEFTQIIKSTA